MPAQYRKPTRSGFTLVELLVVISIIAILSVVGMVVFTNVQKGARDAKRRADIDAITKAFEVKYNTTGSYGNLDPALEENKNLFVSAQFPKDPKGQDYTIIQDSQTKGFRICASLQDNPACSSSSDSCFCKSSQQAEPPATGSSGNITVVTNTDKVDITPFPNIAGCSLRLAADKLPSTTTQVNSLTDQCQSNNANQSDSNKQPTYLANALNSKPVLHFNPNQVLDIPSSSSLQHNGEYTVFVVTRINSFNEGDCCGQIFIKSDWGIGGPTQYQVYTYGVGNLGFYGYGGGNSGQGGPLFSSNNVRQNNTWYILAFSQKFDGSSTKGFWYKNGADISGGSSQTGKTNNAQGNAALGASGNISFDIAELVVYTRALSDSERGQINQYFSTKYNIPVQ